MTDIKTALGKAGFDTTPHRLAILAINCLRVNKLDPVSALEEFLGDIRWNSAMLCELVGEPALASYARNYLRERAADMKGETLIKDSGVKPDGGAPICSVIQHTIGAASTIPAKVGDGVQLNFESQVGDGPVKNSEGSKVQHVDESHVSFGLASSDPHERGAVQCGGESLENRGRSAFKPGNARHTLADIEAMSVVAPGIFNLRLPDGRDGKKVKFYELDKLLGDGAYMMTMAWCEKNHCVPENSSAEIGDVISDTNLRRFDTLARKFAQVARKSGPEDLQKFFTREEKEIGYA